MGQPLRGGAPSEQLLKLCHHAYLARRFDETLFVRSLFRLCSLVCFLLDEPFSKLDPELRGQFRQYVFNEARLRMLPVIMVTHDPADRVAAGGKAIELKAW